MKCLVCGSDYPDDWVTCPKDGNDLRSPTPTVEPPERDADEMIAPAYGLPPMPAPQLMISAYGTVPARPPTPPPVPAMLPAYGMPPVGSKPRPLLALAIVVLVMAGAIVAVVLSR
jgi:hypothetical protein